MKVERIEPVRVGYKGSEMVKAAARGLPFNPNTVDHFIITISADEPGDFNRIREIQQLVTNAIVRQPDASDVVGGALRRRSGPFQRDGKWLALFDLG